MADRGEYMRHYYMANREKAIERTRKWRESNPERALETGRKWRATNLEERRTYERNYYATHTETIRQTKRRWRAANLDKHRIKEQRRRARKRAAAINDFTTDEWNQMVSDQDGRCAYCYCEAPLTIDHIQPISKGGNHTCANICGACCDCNVRKGDMSVVEFIEREY